jgi:hypothetical protein
MLGTNMTLIDKVSRLLLAPPATGRKALLYGLILVAIPTGLRLAFDPALGSRLPFSLYLPFVVLAGALLTWRSAVAVTIASWLIAIYLFVGKHDGAPFGPIEIIGLVIFLFSAFLIIALVEAVRTVVENSLRPARPEGFSAPVVFSLERGQVWASWYGSHSWVRLGPEEDVAEMMRDFLAQHELGKRLEPVEPANP